MGDQSSEVEDLERKFTDTTVEPIKISYAAIKYITKNFVQEIGRGAFGVVYLGGLKNGMVAVKRLFNYGDYSDTQFLDEVKCLKKANHKNIARFLGYCVDVEGEIMEIDGTQMIVGILQRLLCFEYVPNGNLQCYLQEKAYGYEWNIRYQIIKGICEGLHHIHQEHIHHFDLKPANVLLGANMEPKITDFGVSRCINEQQGTMVTNRIFGTLGYIAPEFIDNQQISSKSDIFSLGVVMINLLTGHNGGMVENWHKTIDADCPQIKRCIEIAQKCVERDPHNRPTTSQIIHYLNEMETLIEKDSPIINEPRNDPRSSLHQVVQSFWALPEVAPQENSSSRTMGGKRTVKQLLLSRALTMPASTTVQEVCRRMASLRVGAALLTDSNAQLSGIVTDKDIAKRMIARELKVDETPVWKVMTRHPDFIFSDTLAVEALQKMLEGKFRHLPVMDESEVVAMLHITICLDDAIARMERASEKRKAFRPCLSAIASANSMTVAMVSPGDSVLAATKEMVEARASSVVVAAGSKAQGILTSKDILICVIGQSLSPELTPVEKVMTPNPECATVDMPILDALRTMQEGKFLHLPVMDRDGSVISVLDVIDITQAAITIVEGSVDGIGKDDATTSMLQSQRRSEVSGSKIMSDVASAGSSLAVSHSSFSFNLNDRRGQIHQFSCEVQSLTLLVACILQRLGAGINPYHLPHILYEDEEGDKVVLLFDDDVAAAVDHARLAGWKDLKLFLDSSSTTGRRKDVVVTSSSGGAMASRDAWVAAGAGLVTGISVMAYLRRSG